MVSRSPKDTQRERLIQGMIAAANREGYAGANVSQVIANAGVSRPTFYEYFADKDDCFLQTQQETSQPLLETVETTLAETPYEQALQSAIGAITTQAETHPQDMQFLTNEGLAAGPASLDIRDHTINQITRIIDTHINQSSPYAPTPDIPTQIVIGALHRLIAPPLRRGEHDLSTLTHELTAWLETYNTPIHQHRWKALAPGPQLPRSPHTSELALRPPPPIPPGRTRLTPTQITQNHRERILYATAETALHNGYHATTIKDITTTAKLDKRTFYAHFRDKEQAFLAVHELAVQQTLAVAATGYFSTTDWPDRIWAGIHAASQFQADYSTLSYIGLIDSYAVGSAAVQRVEDNRHAFTIFLQEGNQHSTHHPPPITPEAIATTIFEIGYHLARNKQNQQAPRYTPTSTYIALVPYLGTTQANQNIHKKILDTHQPRPT